jgi:hypothetical protein
MINYKLLQAEDTSLYIDCTYNTFLLLQKHLTCGTELILIGWKIVPNEEHVQCGHRFASQPLANEPLHSSHYYTLCFCIKQYNFHLLTYCQPPVVRHFTNWWHLSHFPWTTAFTRTRGPQTRILVFGVFFITTVKDRWRKFAF